MGPAKRMSSGIPRHHMCGVWRAYPTLRCDFVGKFYLQYHAVTTKNVRNASIANMYSHMMLQNILNFNTRIRYMTLYEFPSRLEYVHVKSFNFHLRMLPLSRHHYKVLEAQVRGYVFLRFDIWAAQLPREMAKFGKKYVIDMNTESHRVGQDLW